MYLCSLLFICATVGGNNEKEKDSPMQQIAGSLPVAADNENVGKGALRAKRALYTTATLLARGVKAARDLLKRTKKAPAIFKNMKEFEKPGNFKTAISDFDSVHPSDVREFKLPTQGKGFYGQIGDRMVVVQEKDTLSGKPTLKIIKELPSNEFRAIRITYTD